MIQLVSEKKVKAKGGDGSLTLKLQSHKKAIVPLGSHGWSRAKGR